MRVVPGPIRSLCLSVLALTFFVQVAHGQGYLPTAPQDEVVQEELPRITSIAEVISRVREIHGRVVMGVDTIPIGKVLTDHFSELEFVMGRFMGNQEHVNLRAVRDARSEVDRLRIGVEKAMTGVIRELREFNGYRSELLRIRSELGTVSGGPDSLLAEIQRREQEELRVLATGTMAVCDTSILKLMTVQERGLRFMIDASLEHDRLTRLIIREEKDVVHRRYAPIWGLHKEKMTPFGEVVSTSWHSFYDLFVQFGVNFWKQLIFLRLVIALLALLPLWYIRRTLRKGEPTLYSEQMRYLDRYPVQVAAITLLVLTPLLFQHVPRVAAEMFFIGLLVPVVSIFLKENPFVKPYRLYLMLGYFALLKVSNILVEVTVFKRILLVLVIFFVPRALLFLRGLLRTGYKHAGRARFIVLLISVQATVGWFANIMGWYRLGNNLITVALDAFFLAIALHIATNAVYEYFLLLADRHQRRGGRVQINLLNARIRIIQVLDVFAVGFWVVSYLQSMDVGELAWSTLTGALELEREILGITFTWSAIVLFFGVLMLSYVLSELLRELFLEASDAPGERRAKGFVLLLRLSVFIAGFMLAVYLAGIPLDRMTMVLGAFGVGIGFGLQNLTNNLVSGVMLALEKPIRPGDAIELGDSQGTVLDIGIRGTRVLDYNGAILIVPNGMLLSQVISNRTLNDRTGLVIVQVNVPVTNDLDRIHEMIEGVMKEFEEEGLAAPVVQLAEMGKAWALFNIRLWVGDIRSAGNKRSEALVRIATEFRKHGVDLEVPNQILLGRQGDEPPVN